MPARTMKKLSPRERQLAELRPKCAVKAVIDLRVFSFLIEARVIIRGKEQNDERKTSREFEMIQRKKMIKPHRRTTVLCFNCNKKPAKQLFQSTNKYFCCIKCAAEWVIWKWDHKDFEDTVLNWHWCPTKGDWETGDKEDCTGCNPGVEEDDIPPDPIEPEFLARQEAGIKNHTAPCFDTEETKKLIRAIDRVIAENWKKKS